ncbi:MAG: glucose 1-dehydrogenase [Bacteroidetes bacterium]|nr:glucose 1-dehydrogenase [Bacteroidota bacterium]
MTRRLENKVALITGGGTGIGKAIAKGYLKEGAKVVISGRRESKLIKVLEEEKEYSGRIDYVVGDVSEFEDAKEMVAGTISRFGKIDILVNNAGVRAGICTVVELTEDEWDRTFNIDVKGSWFCSKFAIPFMIENGGGSIIMINSISSQVGQPKQGCYNAAKAAQESLMKCMAIDFGKNGIRVNAICPAWIETEMNYMQLNEMRKEPVRKHPPGISYNDIISMHPLGRLGKPEDIIGAAIYLGSKDSSWVTGSSLMVDGGYTCQ